MVGALLAVVAVASQGPSPGYLDAIASYRRGDRRAAVAVIWNDDRLKEELARLRRLQSFRFEATVFPYEAAAMLHTDRYFAATEAGAVPKTSELDAAQEILALDPRLERRHEFEPRWFLAVALRFHHTMDWDLALRRLDAGVRRYRDDPQLWLARGSLLETIVLLESQVSDRAKIAAPNPRIRDAAWREATVTQGRLLDAEDCYRRALAADPSLAEARVRLAHVLQRRGRFDRSIPELAAVLQSSAVGAAPRYLAQLFLGAAHEAALRLGEAAAAYESAARTDPEGQSAYVALSYALHRRGDRAGAEAALQAGLARAGRRSHPDPWWVYPWGRSDEAEHLLEQLRQEVSR